MESASSTRDEQPQDRIQQPSTRASSVQQANIEEGLAVSSSGESTPEENGLLESTQESISRHLPGNSYTTITAGDGTRNVWGNINPYVKRAYNLFENKIAEKEYRIKTVLGIIGICLFFLSTAVGLYIYVTW